jgi:lipid II:glycine glycyltransferase (peptidoglycan interpeptide bridge formation enzyme)
MQAFRRLNCITRRRHGIPPQPFRFFDKIYEHVISKNRGFVVLASYEDRVIAGAIFFHFGEKAVWKYNGSERSFHRLRGNNLILWEAIKWYCQNGYERICFGRTEPEDEGLRKFKVGWGAREEKEKYCRYDLGRDEFLEKSWVVTEKYRQIFRRMPPVVLNAIGSMLYRHVG